MKKELSFRVHFAETVEEVHGLVDRFVDAKLPKLRHRYYNRHFRRLTELRS